MVNTSTDQASTLSTPFPGNSGNGPARKLPPLRPGDRLSVAEFRRRYEAMPSTTKAELINGVVYMPSPISDDYHGTPHSNLQTLFGWYHFNTPGVRAGDNSTMRMPPEEEGDHEPQPDSHLRIEPECGGQTRTDENGYMVGAPELAGEIAYSPASYDLHDKKELFRQKGVQEYVVWRVEDHALDWFRLRSENYASLHPDAAGVICSEVFPGLWINVPALLSKDFAKLQATLQAGLASPEHARFVDELARRRHR